MPNGAWQNPVVFVPGIKGSSLRDRYPPEHPRTLYNRRWLWDLLGTWDRLALHPDDVRYEQVQPAQVYPEELILLVYNEFIGYLQQELSPSRLQPTPVFAFPYDWRLPLRDTARQLDRFIREVVDRTCLLPHYAQAGYANAPAVDLVGHSMGGLIICECVHEWAQSLGQPAGSQPGIELGRAATIATPYHGSIEAIIRMITGVDNLDGQPPSPTERKAARTMPAVYDLLPSFDMAVMRGTRTTVDIFDPDQWQSSVVSSLAETIEVRSVKTYVDDATGSADDHRRADARRLFEQLLAQAREHRDRVENLAGAITGLGLRPEEHWLVVAGLGAKTRCQLRIEGRDDNTWFRIADSAWEDRSPSRRSRSSTFTFPRTGDGTVPLASAVPAFLEPEHVICVGEKDLEWSEAIGDRALIKAAQLHAALPEINLVQKLVTQHLRPSWTTITAGRSVLRGRRIPGAPRWKPPIKGLERHEIK